jgi:hypothetical protein
MAIIYRPAAFLPLSPQERRQNDDSVLLRILVNAVALSLVLLQGFLVHRLLSPGVTNAGGIPSEEEEARRKA